MGTPGPERRTPAAPAAVAAQSPAIVLASASPRRRALLEAAGVSLTVHAAHVDESLPSGAAPAHAATEIALRKARTVATQRPDRVVVGADTVVVTAAGEILGKPADAADATRMLRALSGTTQRVITGVAIVWPGGDIATFATTTHVTMRALGDSEIADYVASGEPFDKAGAYAIQETGDRFVERIDGCRDNVVGLPVREVVERLAANAERLGARGQSR